MNHVEIERALARVCLAREPDPADIAALGAQPSRWVLYRNMVRSRFRETIASGLPRTREAAGHDAFGRAFDEFLATAPPRSRLIREASLEFARFASARWAPGADASVPPWTADLARFEATQLTTAFAPGDPPADAIGEFAMDRPVLLAPSHARVRVAWDVHEPTPAAGHARGDFALLTYRDRATLRVETRVLTQTAGELLDVLGDGRSSTTDAIVSVVARHGGAADEAFLASVADLLADLMDRGILLGSSVATKR